MLQIAPRTEAGDLLDGLGQGVDQAVGGVGSLGKHPWAELTDKPRGAVAAASAGRRTVSLPVVAAAALVEHLGSYSQPGPDGLVFTSTEGALLRRSNFNRRVWRPATRAVGLEGLRFHDLRHTSATLSIAAGASTRELMAGMGHSSSAAALRYQHVMAGRDAAIAAALDELIEAASALAESPPSARVARGWHESGNRVAPRSGAE
jgi:integrase